MKRRNAGLVVAAVLGLVAVLVAWQLLRQRRAAADALVADLAAHGAEVERAPAELPDIPPDPTEVDLHFQVLQIDERMREITARATELRDRWADVSSRATLDWQERINEAGAGYVVRLQVAQEQFQKRRQERQARIVELRAKRSKK